VDGRDQARHRLATRQAGVGKIGGLAIIPFEVSVNQGCPKPFPRQRDGMRLPTKAWKFDSSPQPG